MDRSGRPKLGFIGTGGVATALARGLSDAGYEVVAVHGRNRRRTEA
ncbi:MAG: NAD(P)-binding domain-containing protein, partial [Candidatus Bipolaricaulota bacterium]|nr:NAD(P)-binding domain-containing protein [Candidatus Bipolaricaulota bacterium]